MQACRQVIYIRPIILRAISQSYILFKSVRQTRFGPLLYSSLLYRLDQDRQSKYILVESVRKTLFERMFQSSLHPCFDREFQSSLSRDTCFMSLYITRVYSIQKERNTFFACLFFNRAFLLCRSILVESIKRHRYSIRQRHSNVCPSIYQSSLIYLSIDIDTCFACLFFKPTSSHRKSILVKS